MTLTIGQQERFWAKVHKTDTCWEWTGALWRGYGYFRTWIAHRVAYELLVGPIPPEKQVDHLCRNRGCVNPEHMELVTSYENILRGEGPTAANKRKLVCSNGHPFTPENTI